MADLVVYTSKYFNKDDSNDSMVSIIGKDALKQYFIVHDRLKWKFLAFNSSSDYLIYRKNLLPEERCFHEQIIGDEPQRIKFDIDAPRDYIIRLPNTIVDSEKYGCISKIENIIMFIADMIIKTINEEYVDELPYPAEINNNILITEANGEDKYSYHIIVVHYKLKNNIECKYFTTKVLSKLPDQLTEIIDLQVNKGVQSFRLLGSIKEGTNRRKIISEFSPVVNSGFIQDLDDTDLLLLPKKDYVKEMKSGMYLPPDILATIIHKVYDKWPEFAQFRDEKNKFLNFNRLNGSYCDYCEKVHDRDNSLMITWDKISHGTYIFRYGCRKYTGSRQMEVFVELKDKPYDRMRALNDIIEGLHNKVLTPEDRFARYGRHVNILEEDHILDIQNHTVSYIKAGMKMGKTKALIKYINELDPKISICVLSFRLTFSQELHSKLPGFKLYNDIGGKILSSTNKRLIIQIESLSRLSGNYDIVVLDESESILNQFSSGNVKNLTFAFATFERLIMKAKKVIAMDAYLSERTIDVINYISGTEDYTIDYYTHQNAKDYNYIVGYYKNNSYFLKEINKVLQEKVVVNRSVMAYAMTKSKLQISGELLQYVYNFIGTACYRNKNIAIITNCKKEVDAIHKYILMENPDIKRTDIEKYTSATETGKKKEHMKDIHTHWMKRVIIYTPTITAGLSFEKIWFDQIFAYFNNASCDVLSCMQMLGRIRNLSDRRITIAVDINSINCSTSIEAIKKDIEFNRYNLLKSSPITNIVLAPPKDLIGQQDYQVVENNYWHLWVHNTRMTNVSRKRFLYALCDCILETGARITTFDKSLGKEHQALTSIKKEIREETAKAISLISLPTSEEIEKIINKIDEQEDLTPEEDLKFKKRRIQTIFGIEDKDKEVLDRIEFILKYNKPHVIEWYKHLKAITLRSTISESLEVLKEIESRRYTHIDQCINRLEFKPSFVKHMASYVILNDIFTLDSFIETTPVNIKDIIENIVNNKDKIRKAYKIMELYPPSLTDDALKDDIAMIIKNLNRIPYSMYGHKLLSEDNIKFILKNYTAFNIDKNGVSIDYSIYK